MKNEKSRIQLRLICITIASFLVWGCQTTKKPMDTYICTKLSGEWSGAKTGCGPTKPVNFTIRTDCSYEWRMPELNRTCNGNFLAILGDNQLEYKNWDCGSNGIVTITDDKINLYNKFTGACYNVDLKRK